MDITVIILIAMKNNNIADRLSRIQALISQVSGK